MNEDNTPRQERNQTESEAVSFGVNVLGDSIADLGDNGKDGNESMLDSIGEGASDLSGFIEGQADNLADSIVDSAGTIAETVGECTSEIIGSLLD